VTDINGVPILNAPEPATDAQNAVAIAEVPIELPPEQSVFELKLREPGIVRSVGFWLHEPKVVASAMRGVQKIAMPMLFVECNPHGEMQQMRVFAFIPSNGAFTPKPGWTARYLTTAVGPAGARHLFELVEVS
jgi:hypothetical protein